MAPLQLRVMGGFAAVLPTGELFPRPTSRRTPAALSECSSPFNRI